MSGDHTNGDIPALESEDPQTQQAASNAPKPVSEAPVTQASKPMDVDTDDDMDDIEADLQGSSLAPNAGPSVPAVTAPASTVPESVPPKGAALPINRGSTVLLNKAQLEEQNKKLVKLKYCLIPVDQPVKQTTFSAQLGSKARRVRKPKQERDMLPFTSTKAALSTMKEIEHSPVANATRKRRKGSLNSVSSRVSDTSKRASKRVTSHNNYAKPSTGSKRPKADDSKNRQRVLMLRAKLRMLQAAMERKKAMPATAPNAFPSGFAPPPRATKRKEPSYAADAFGYGQPQRKKPATARPQRPKKKSQKFAPDVQLPHDVAEARKALMAIRRKRANLVFCVPVDTNTYTDYLIKVQNPMDIGTIIQRIENGHYETLDQVHADVNQVWENARLYNGDQSPLYLFAKSLQNEFDGKIAKYLQKREQSRNRRAVQREAVPAAEAQPDTQEPEFSLADKKALKDAIVMLDGHHLEAAVAIIQESLVDPGNEAEEIEIDMDLLGTDTLKRLQSYISSIGSSESGAAQQAAAPISSLNPHESSSDSSSDSDSSDDVRKTANQSHEAKFGDPTSSLFATNPAGTNVVPNTLSEAADQPGPTAGDDAPVILDTEINEAAVKAVDTDAWKSLEAADDEPAKNAAPSTETKKGDTLWSEFSNKNTELQEKEKQRQAEEARLREERARQEEQRQQEAKRLEQQRAEQAAREQKAKEDAERERLQKLEEAKAAEQKRREQSGAVDLESQHALHKEAASMGLAGGSMDDVLGK